MLCSCAMIVAGLAFLLIHFVKNVVNKVVRYYLNNTIGWLKVFSFLITFQNCWYFAPSNFLVCVFSICFTVIINFLSWKKIPRANWSWVNKFVSTGVTVAENVLIKRLKSATAFIKNVLCIDSVLLYFFSSC